MHGAQTIVVGGGLAGLAAGFELSGLGPCTVLEADDEVGGLARTRREGGFLFDQAAHAMALPRGGSAEALLSRAGLAHLLVDPVARSKRRLLWSGGAQPRLVPLGPPDALSLVGAAGIARALAEPLIPDAARDDETVGAFFRRRLGDKLGNLIARALVTGIYAGDPEELGAHDAFPDFANLARPLGGFLAGALAARRAGRQRPRVCAPAGGFGALSKALADAIVTRGGLVRRGARVFSLSEPESGGVEVTLESGEVIGGRAAVIALPGGETAELLADLSPEATSEMRAIPTAAIAVVGLGFSRADVAHPLDAYGFISLAPDQLGALACVFETSVFEGRAPDGQVFLRVMLGGRREPTIAAAEPAALIARARAALSRSLGIEATPRIAFTANWPAGLPQYLPGHQARVARVRGLLARTGAPIELAGQVWDGVGTARAMASGALAAERLARGFR